MSIDTLKLTFFYFFAQFFVDIDEKSGRCECGESSDHGIPRQKFPSNNAPKENGAQHGQRPDVPAKQDPLYGVVG